MLRPRIAVRTLVTIPCFMMLLATIAILPCFAANTATVKADKPSGPAVVPLVTPERPVLPQTFAGWNLSGTSGAPQQSQSPQAADPANADVLTEYGFERYESAEYERDQDTVTLRAMQFGDATGAFGAFTFYRRPNMAPEQIGQGAAFDGTRVLLWNGTVLVEAKFSRMTPMSAAELRDLVRLLPQPIGNQGILPALPAYLPVRHLQSSTIQYALGPQSYQRSGGVLPASLVDFNRSAETVTAQYDALNGPGTLTIINYPTPEIAIEREHAIKNYIASRGVSSGAAAGQGQNAWTAALAASNPEAIQTRRSGPLVAITSGSFTAGTAGELLQQVHYEVNLTMSNSAPYVPDTTKVAQIIIGVAFLVGFFALIAIVAGVSLGGGRVLWRKMRSKSGGANEEPEEFIRLNLKD